MGLGRARDERATLRVGLLPAGAAVALLLSESLAARSDALGLWFGGFDESAARLLINGLASAAGAALGALAVAIWMARRIIRPLGRIIATVNHLANGELSARVRCEGGSRVRRLGDALNRLAERLEAGQTATCREFATVAAELQARRAEAELASVAKTRFLAAASHDLRQPIHAMSLFVDLLARRPLEAESARLVQRIGQSVQTVGTLLDALLDISRLDSGALEPDVRAFPLQQVFDGLDELAGQAACKGLRWRLRPSAHWVRSDPALLERIVRNLAANAVRYTERGGVLLAARRAGGHLRLEIRDSGIGIDRKSQELVFEEFVQLGNAERNRDKGLGLGLAIVLRLGRLLHHPLGLRSAPGRGSVFWIEVPLATPESGIDRSGGGDDSAVAVVDSDPRTVDELAGLLGHWGCRVYAGLTPREIELALAADGRRPDLVICGSRLGDGETGVAVIDRWREAFGANLPAVLLAAEGGPKPDSFAGRCSLPVLHRPVRPAKLRATVRTLLDLAAEAAATDGRRAD